MLPLGDKFVIFDQRLENMNLWVTKQNLKGLWMRINN